MKSHLLDSEEPLREGLPYVAVCGLEVKDAVFPFIFDADMVGQRAYEAMNKLQICSDCLKQTWEGRYLYGLLPGQAMKETEAA